MPDYVVLMTVTEKGAGDLFDATGFVEDMVEIWKAKCGPVAAFRITMGAHDLVLFGEAPDDDKAAEYALYASQTGRVRTTTMRAFRLETLSQLVTEAAEFGPRRATESPA
jgi:uncharacterized protein with GYD domain